MCGIAGQFRFDGAAVTHDVLEAMTGSLKHRGPDGTGCYLRDNAGLAMTRLAIIDVAGGQQPILNERNNIAIVCNGEIYNHLDLRPELERQGHIFKTHSDVEVVLHLYEEHGPDCFQYLNGMFGVAIADFEKGRLVLARDRCGQKPLYLWRQAGCVTFASELKALAELPDFPRTLSPEAQTSFLAYSYMPAPLTVFEAVEKLHPGSFLTVDETGQVDSKRYWQINLSENGHRPPRTEKAGMLGQVMGAVERHLMSERPLGVFLSGGVDSSAIVASMHLAGHRDIRTYTVGFEGFLENEFQDARQIADHFKTSHHEILLTPDNFWETLDAIIYSVDEPMADQATIPLYHLAQRASQDVIVVLSGEGSDELLAGYRSLRSVRKTFDRLHAARPLAPLLQVLRKGHLLSDRLLGRLRAVTESDADYLARSIYSYLGTFDTTFRSAHGTELANCGDPLKPMANYYRDHQDWSGMNLTLGGMMEWWLPDDLLHKADRVTMAHSIELRCPFLDADFIQYCAGLNLNDKIIARDGEANRKIALKQAFADVLPPGFVYKKKKGFVTPVRTWLQTIYRDRARSEVMREGALASRLFGPDVRSSIMDGVIAGDELSQQRAWNLIVLNKWGARWL